ncbi:adp-Ribosyl-[Dinitrogen reductase] hydrolase [Arthrobacter sp. Hiyo8]|nr:adp-Ribosyl-[Dinitrogen reductase] hydrolase [Arthrobacter sp. Hiyo8]
MTLYTVDGLVEALEWANDGVAADETACLWLAYLRWLASQGVALPASAPVPQPRWIDGQEVLRHRRHPGKACLSGLATGEMGTKFRPVNPESKGCGTVMRSAPFGLVPHISEAAVYKLSTDAACLTHGHPSARQSAGAFSVLVHKVTAGSDVRTAAEHALSVVSALPDPAPSSWGASGRRWNCLPPARCSARKNSPRNWARAGSRRRHSPSGSMRCWRPRGQRRRGVIRPPISARP